jgi:hypothetical protein
MFRCFLKGERMRSATALLLVLLAASLASSQTLILDAAGAQDGKYWIEVTVRNGKVQAEVVDGDNVLVLTGDPTDPGDPGDMEGLARVALSAKAMVTDDPNKDDNSVKLSILYEALADKIGDQFVHQGGEAPWQKLSDATKQTRNMLLGGSADAWTPWSTAVGKALAAMEAANQLDNEDQMRDAYNDIADGLVADLSREELDPQWIELIMKIIELVLQLIG